MKRIQTRFKANLLVCVCLLPTGINLLIDICDISALLSKFLLYNTAVWIYYTLSNTIKLYKQCYRWLYVNSSSSTMTSAQKRPIKVLIKVWRDWISVACKHSHTKHIVLNVFEINWTKGNLDFCRGKFHDRKARLKYLWYSLKYSNCENSIPCMTIFFI